MSAVADVSRKASPALEAVRETVGVLDGSVTVRLPASFCARRVEVIVLPAAEGDTVGPPRRQRPAPELASTVIHDDLIEPAVTAAECTAVS